MLEGLNFLKVHTANTQLYVSVSQRRINSNLKLEESGSQRLFKHHSLIMSLCLLDALVHFTTVKHTHTHTQIHTMSGLAHQQSYSVLGQVVLPAIGTTLSAHTETAQTQQGNSRYQTLSSVWCCPLVSQSEYTLQCQIRAAPGKSFRVYTF